MITQLRRLAATALLLIWIPAMADNHSTPAVDAESPISGMQMIQTEQPFGTYIENLKKAISANKMGIVAHACATCGARKIGVTIPGNEVIMVYHPRFAVRMLEASIAAGIEAPLRLYVTEQQDGSAVLSYRLPSHTFAPYNSKALDSMAAELDQIIEQIAKDAR